MIYTIKKEYVQVKIVKNMLDKKIVLHIFIALNTDIDDEFCMSVLKLKTSGRLYIIGD